METQQNKETINNIETSLIETSLTPAETPTDIEKSNESYPTNKQATKFVKKLMKNNNRTAERDEYARCICYKIKFNWNYKFTVDLTEEITNEEQEQAFKDSFINNWYSIKNYDTKLEKQNEKLTETKAKQYLRNKWYIFWERSDWIYVKHRCFQWWIYKKEGNNLIRKVDVQIEYDNLSKQRLDEEINNSR